MTRVLVTGGTGFVGRALVPRLIEEGYAVRVLARPTSKVEDVQRAGAEVARGDVTDRASFGGALSGCELVVHLAAGTGGTPKDRETTLRGTRNLLDLYDQERPQRIVFISSCSVYGVSDYPAGEVVSETASLERFPELRGSYSASKLEAEGYVIDAVARGVPATILRPGTIYGPGGELFTPMMGFTRKSWYVVIDVHGFVMPLVHVDNLVEAIVLCMRREQAVGEIFNVVDPDSLDKRAYVERVIRRIDPAARVVYLPYALVFALTWFQERVFKLVRRSPRLTCYRLQSSQKPVTYDTTRIVSQLGWRPIVSLPDAVERLVKARVISPRADVGDAAPVTSQGDTAERSAS